jgi:hypothetical protein
MSSSEISSKVRYLLWAKSAGRCEFDGCNKPLWRDGLTQIEMNFADVAHIIGDSSDGPRGDVILSPEYCNDGSNLMLMCLEHHRMIDQITSVYTDETLRHMKKVHEERIERLTAIKPDKTSHVLIYRGMIGEHQPKIDYRDAWSAMAPEWYPSSKLPIELGLHNSAFQDNEEKFWHFEEENLERLFNTKVKPFLASDTETNHFSIFAFAAQPLLIKLGTLFSDIHPAEVYQRHREPQTWGWIPGSEKFEYQLVESESSERIVALNLSLSATIDSSRIERLFGDQKYSEWILTIENPNNDFLKSREQIQKFRMEFRALLNRIKAKHGENAILHVFPAVPVSVAVEIGRVWQPKADLPMIIYDQNRKLTGFIKTLSMGDVKND